ncbi:MAG: hypothetical protein V1772_05210, partial [Chloroflexota bacterium]
TCAIISSSELPAAPHALALDTPRGRLYVGHMGSGQVLALDLATLAVRGVATLGGLGYPQALALDASSGRLYVAHALSPKYGAISVIAAADMSVLATRWGGRERTLWGAQAVVLDPRRGRVGLDTAQGMAWFDAKSLAPGDGLTLSGLGWGRAVTMDVLEGVLYLAGEGGRLWSWPLASEGPAS